MFARKPWRLALFHLSVVLLVMGGLRLYLGRTSCLGDLGCIRSGVWIAAAAMVLLPAILTLVMVKQTAAPIRELTAMIRHIPADEPHGAILTQRRDDVGEFIRAFNFMAERVNQRISDLCRENRQLAMIAEYTVDGVLIVDDQGYVRLINPAARKLLATDEERALNRSAAEVLRQYQLIDLWQRCLEEGEEQIEAIEIGEKRFIQAYITPFEREETQGFLVFLQDLTEIRRLETVRRDFISNLSHELRTPLASLHAVVETLQDGAIQDPPAASRFLERAQHELDTMIQMVEELLELSRIESGQVPLQFAPAAIYELISIPVERLKPLADRGEVQLNIELAPDLPPVLADAGRVRQVVANLLHNAIKFSTPQGNVRIRAWPLYRSNHAEASQLPAEIVIEIKDNGVGIAASDLPRIFERFYKSDRARSRAHGGTGLGLAIARHIVQAHNGRIWAKSKEGRGSTFYFTLPVSNESTSNGLEEKG